MGESGTERETESSDGLVTAGRLVAIQESDCRDWCWAVKRWLWPGLVGGVDCYSALKGSSNKTYNPIALPSFHETARS